MDAVLEKERSFFFEKYTETKDVLKNRTGIKRNMWSIDDE